MDTDVIIVGAGPDEPYRVTARYLVGCDGPRSRVRELNGIPFPGTTHPEVNLPGRHALPDSVADPSVSPPGSTLMSRRVREGRPRWCARCDAGGRRPGWGVCRTGGGIPC
ncbi:FAD-dependent monooxygenase [Streptomyces mirabilis]